MDELPFEGREAELSRIRSLFLAPGTAAVMLTAPAGMGKTRLARQALSVLGCTRTGWVAATRAAAAVPFAAVAPLVPDGPPGGPLALMRAAARNVRAWGGPGQVAVGVDDAHLLDDASATLIAHLIAQGVAFFVLTARAGEPVSDVLARLCADGRATRIEVPALPDAVMDRLIEHGAARPLDPSERRRLRQTARGNPMALRELLYGAQPCGLTELVAARLDRLDPAARYAVELVACGEPLSLSILERLAGLRAVATAEDCGLVVTERSGMRVLARLDHPLYGEVLRGRLPLSRTTEVYRALAGALLDTPLRRRNDALLAALWQVEGREIRRPDVVRTGAWLAIGLADLALAERLARAAQAAEPDGRADRLMAEILSYRGRTGEAAQVLPAAPPPEPAERVAWAVTRAETLYWGDGDIDAAHAALDTAAGHPIAEASRSWLLCFAARCADAVRVAQRVLDDPHADPKSVIWAAAAGTASHGFLGHPDQGDDAHRRGAAMARAHLTAVPWGVVEVDTAACLAQLAGGQAGAAERIAESGYQAALDGGAAMMVTSWALYAGLAAAARGHLDRADRLLAEAATGFDANDTFRLARGCLAAFAAVAAQRGDAGAAADLMARADSLAHPSNAVFGPWIETWRAWAAYGRGDLPAAVTAANRAADLAREAGMPAVEALARYDVARMGHRPDADRLDAIDHDLARLLAGAAIALDAPDGAVELEATAHVLQARGYDLHAAEAFATAASRHHRYGRGTRARLAAASAGALRAAFPTARTPLLQSVRITDLLTPREREVVLLATRHTSAEIAVRLRLAVPTVNNNLARAYTKLGISGRAQLRELLSGGDANRTAG